MTSLTPRPPYTDEELARLYPDGLQLQLVQILLRHGERTPVSPRFRNAGLHPYWPYCNAAQRLKSTILERQDLSEWGEIEWRRRLETFGHDDSPIVASGPNGEVDAVCQPGELTDEGRASTLALGQRLRHLYVEQLKFMPKLIADSDMIYLRATPIPRALDSAQQAFRGLYPASARTAAFPAPTILTRSPADETLYPNDGNCRRLAQLSRAFAQRTADRWNDSADMAYLTKRIGKWMPQEPKKVAVDSHPRLSGIMDTINSTLAHGPETRLPSEFYDKKAGEIIDRISVEEWFSGYRESLEYRTLGIGSLMGDIVGRMVGSIGQKGTDGLIEIGGNNGELGVGRGGETSIKLALSGCHDTTLAAMLTSLGAFDGEQWPPYTSHVAIELFRELPPLKVNTAPGGSVEVMPKDLGQQLQPSGSWWSSFFKDKNGSSTSEPANFTDLTDRKVVTGMSASEKKQLDNYYVRVRFNDRVMQIPGCKAEGKHFKDDHSFCTMAAFKEIVDKYTPEHWKKACVSNLDSPAFPAEPQLAGS